MKEVFLAVFDGTDECKFAVRYAARRAKINEADLLYFLKKRKHFRVALDVIDGEWLSRKDLKNHRLIKYSKINQNLLIVPHIGGSTEESIYGARAFQVKQILRLLKNKI